MKRGLAIFVVVLVAVLLLPGGFMNPKTVRAASTSGDSYITMDGGVQNLPKNASGTNLWTVLTTTTTTSLVASPTSYYVAEAGTLTLGDLTVEAGEHIDLILKKDAAVTVNGTISLGTGASLTIYAQDTAPSSAGTLTVNGGVNRAVSGEQATLTLVDGTLTATANAAAQYIMFLNGDTQSRGKMDLQGPGVASSTNFYAIWTGNEYAEMVIHGGVLTSNTQLAPGGDFTMNNGEVTLNTPDHGVTTQGRFVMNGGSFRCEVVGGGGILGVKGVAIHAGTVNCVSHRNLAIAALGPIVIDDNAQVTAQGYYNGIAALTASGRSPNITIAGSGTKVSAISTAAFQPSDDHAAMYADDDITIRGGDVQTSSAAPGIPALWAKGELDVSGGALLASATNFTGIQANGITASGGSLTGRSGSNSPGIKTSGGLTASGNAVVTGESDQGFGIDAQTQDTTLALTGGAPKVSGTSRRDGWGILACNANVAAGTLTGESNIAGGVNVLETLNTSGSGIVVGTSSGNGAGITAKTINAGGQRIEGESKGTGAGIKADGVLTHTSGMVIGKSVTGGSGGGIFAATLSSSGGTLTGTSAGEGFGVRVTNVLTVSGNADVKGTSADGPGIQAGSVKASGSAKLTGTNTQAYIAPPTGPTGYEARGVLVNGGATVGDSASLVGQSNNGDAVRVNGTLIVNGSNAAVRGTTQWGAGVIAGTANLSAGAITGTSRHSAGVGIGDYTVSGGTLTGTSAVHAGVYVNSIAVSGAGSVLGTGLDIGVRAGADLTVAAGATGKVFGESTGNYDGNDPLNIAGIQVERNMTVRGGTVESKTNGAPGINVYGALNQSGGTINGNATRYAGIKAETLAASGGTMTGKGGDGTGVWVTKQLTVSGTGRVNGEGGAQAGVLADAITLSDSGVLTGRSNSSYGVRADKTMSVRDGYIEASGGSAVQNVGLYYGDTTFTVSGGGFYVAKIDGKATPKNSQGQAVYLTNVTGLPTGRYSIVPMSGYANGGYPLLKNRDGAVNAFLPVAASREYTFNRSGSGIYFATGAIQANNNNELAASQRSNVTSGGEWITVWPRYSTGGSGSSKPNPGTGLH